MFSMELKRLILGALVAASCFPAISAGDYLQVRTSDGWVVLDLDQVDRLSFAGNVMTASDKNNNVVKTIPQTSLIEMSYSESAAGIEAVVAPKAEATFTFDAASGVVTVSKDGSIEVYTTDGKALVVISEVKAGETVNLSAITEGVVIIKSGDYAVKTVLK